MALLLDTHTFLWFIDNDPRLSTTAADRIADPSNQVWVSVVSAWEIVIKLGTGKLTLDRPLAELWPESMLANDCWTSPPCTCLQLPPHHKDPFDRLLIAQAMADQFELVSADTAFAPYPVRCVW